MSGNEEELKLRVKTADGREEIEVATTPNETILDLKNKISQMMNLSPEKYLRLIFGGKLLDPPESIVGSYKTLKSGSFVHAVVSSRVQATSQSAMSPPTTGAANLRGLDTLLIPNAATGRPGLTTADITTMRSVYRVNIDQFAAVHLTRNDNESADEFRLRCESEWMAAQDTHSEFQSNLRAFAMFRPNAPTTFPSTTNTSDDDDSDTDRRRATAGYLAGGYGSEQEVGTSRDFVIGFCLGLGFGFIMLFCIWDRNISHRQKVGILCGILAQGFMGSFSSRRDHHEGATGGTLRGSNSNNNAHTTVVPSSRVNSGVVDVHANDAAVGLSSVSSLST